jgi:RNA polymerase sigma factor (sigma-70 family)
VSVNGPGDQTPSRRRRRQSWSDARLIGACLEGDVEAWSELLDRYAGLVYSVALNVGLTNDDAADVLQNVSMIMLDHLSDLRSAERISAWLITVTRREAVRIMKRNAARNAGALPCPIEDAVQIEDPDAANMAGRLVALQDQQYVRQAMAKLPPRCRQVIELLFCSDPPATYAEVAAKLGIPTGSVGPTRARCLEKLRKILNDVGF